MSSNALDSQGMLIKVGDGGSPETFTTIPEVKNIAGPGGAAAVIDVSDLSSLAKEKRMGLQDEGQITLTINYIPGNTQHARLRSLRASQLKGNFQLIFTDAGPTQWDFSGFVTSFAQTAAVDAVLEATVTIEVTGNIAES